MLILDQLLQGLKAVCAAFPDKRKGGGVYSMEDIGLSAFSLFFMQSESFLSYQRSLEEGRKTSNCQSLFGMARIPTDNHIRAMLDPVHPSHLQPVFDQVIATLEARGGLEPFQRLGGRTLVALDGTEYFCSQSLWAYRTASEKRIALIFAQNKLNAVGVSEAVSDKTVRGTHGDTLLWSVTVEPVARDNAPYRGLWIVIAVFPVSGRGYDAPALIQLRTLKLLKNLDYG